MIRASAQFTDEQRQRINAAIAEVESKTAAQIVPVVASASGRYDRAEDAAGLWAGAALLAVVYAFVPEYSGASGDWAGVTPGWKLAMMLAALVAGFVIGAAIVSRVWNVRRLFTPRRQMHDEVRRAAAAFHDASLHRTGGGAGLLLYVSLYERVAAVLGDDAIAQRLGPEAIDELCDNLTRRLGEADVTTALMDAIGEVGSRLASAMPRAEGDTNDLPDELVVLD